jgi:fatty-acyl-CoA synthase
MLEAHFGVPLAGAVLNAINCRLDADGVAFILQHGEAKLVLVDREFAPLAAKPSQAWKGRRCWSTSTIPKPRRGLPWESATTSRSSRATPRSKASCPATSGIRSHSTTPRERPAKGVVPSHRGTYLMSLLQLAEWAVPRAPVYFWTLPMFHANGWCFTWAITAAGTHVCLRKVTAPAVFDAIAEHSVDHFCAAPTVMAMLASASPDARKSLGRPVRVLTAGSPPARGARHWNRLQRREAFRRAMATQERAAIEQEVSMLHVANEIGPF